MLRSLGGLSGPLYTADYFICLVARLLQICPSPAIVQVMLEQDVHKYMRAAALVLIRLIGNAELQKKAIAVGWSDYRKVCVYGHHPSSETQRLSALRSPAALPDAKRPREEPHSSASELLPPLGTEEELLTSDLGIDPLTLHTPQYFLLRLDEFTDYLFGLPPPSWQPCSTEVATEGGGANDDNREKCHGKPAAAAVATKTAAITTTIRAHRTLHAHTFLGIYLPSLIL